MSRFLTGSQSVVAGSEEKSDGGVNTTMPTEEVDCCDPQRCTTVGLSYPNDLGSSSARVGVNLVGKLIQPRPHDDSPVLDDDASPSESRTIFDNIGSENYLEVASDVRSTSCEPMDCGALDKAASGITSCNRSASPLLRHLLPDDICTTASKSDASPLSHDDSFAWGSEQSRNDCPYEEIALVGGQDDKAVSLLVARNRVSGMPPQPCLSVGSQWDCETKAMRCSKGNGMLGGVSQCSSLSVKDCVVSQCCALSPSLSAAASDSASPSSLPTILSHPSVLPVSTLAVSQSAAALINSTNAAASSSTRPSMFPWLPFGDEDEKNCRAVHENASFDDENDTNKLHPSGQDSLRSGPLPADSQFREEARSGVPASAKGEVGSVSPGMREKKWATGLIGPESEKNGPHECHDPTVGDGSSLILPSDGLEGACGLPECTTDAARFPNRKSLSSQGRSQGHTHTVSASLHDSQAELLRGRGLVANPSSPNRPAKRADEACGDPSVSSDSGVSETRQSDYPERGGARAVLQTLSSSSSRHIDVTLPPPAPAPSPMDLRADTDSSTGHLSSEESPSRGCLAANGLASSLPFTSPESTSGLYLTSPKMASDTPRVCPSEAFDSLHTTLQELELCEEQCSLNERDTSSTVPPPSPTSSPPQERPEFMGFEGKLCRGGLWKEGNLVLHRGTRSIECQSTGSSNVSLRASDSLSQSSVIENAAAPQLVSRFAGSQSFPALVESGWPGIDESSLEKYRSSLRRYQSSLESNQLSLQSNQSPLESNRSSLESNRSSLEGNRSPMESNRSPMESNRSPMESNRSPMESSRSPMESNRSPMESSRSPMESNRSSLESKQSASGINRSALESTDALLLRNESVLKLLHGGYAPKLAEKTGCATLESSGGLSFDSHCPVDGGSDTPCCESPVLATEFASTDSQPRPHDMIQEECPPQEDTWATVAAAWELLLGKSSELSSTTASNSGRTGECSTYFGTPLAADAEVCGVSMKECVAGLSQPQQHCTTDSVTELHEADSTRHASWDGKRAELSSDCIMGCSDSAISDQHCPALEPTEVSMSASQIPFLRSSSTPLSMPSSLTQPRLQGMNGNFDANEMGKLKNAVAAARQNQQGILLDREFQDYLPVRRCESDVDILRPNPISSYFPSSDPAVLLASGAEAKRPTLFQSSSFPCALQPKYGGFLAPDNSDRFFYQSNSVASTELGSLLSLSTMDTIGSGPASASLSLQMDAGTEMLSDHLEVSSLHGEDERQRVRCKIDNFDSSFCLRGGVNGGYETGQPPKIHSFPRCQQQIDGENLSECFRRMNCTSSPFALEEMVEVDRVDPRPGGAQGVTDDNFGESRVPNVDGVDKPSSDLDYHPRPSTGLTIDDVVRIVDGLLLAGDASAAAAFLHRLHNKSRLQGLEGVSCRLISDVPVASKLQDAIDKILSSSFASEQEARDTLSQLYPVIPSIQPHSIPMAIEKDGRVVTLLASFDASLVSQSLPFSSRGYEAFVNFAVTTNDYSLLVQVESVAAALGVCHTPSSLLDAITFYGRRADGRALQLFRELEQRISGSTDLGSQSTSRDEHLSDRHLSKLNAVLEVAEYSNYSTLSQLVYTFLIKHKKTSWLQGARDALFLDRLPSHSVFGKNASWEGDFHVDEEAGGCLTPKATKNTVSAMGDAEMPLEHRQDRSFSDSKVVTRRRQVVDCRTSQKQSSGRTLPQTDPAAISPSSTASTFLRLPAHNGVSCEAPSAPPLVPPQSGDDSGRFAASEDSLKEDEPLVQQVRACVEAKDRVGARALLLEWKKKKNMVSRRAQTILLDFCCSCGAVEDANECFDGILQAHSANCDSFLRIIVANCDAGNIAKAFSLISQLKPSGVQLNETMVSAVLSLVVKQSPSNGYTRAVQTLKRASPDADQFIASYVARKLRVTSDKNLMRSLLSMTDTLELRSHDPGVLNTLLDTCMKLKDTKRVVFIAEELRRISVLPDLQTYGILIKALGSCGRIDDCIHLWKELNEDRGLEPNEVTYGCIFDALVRNSQVDEAIKYFREMKAKGRVTPNTIMYSTIIKGFAQAKQLDGALEVYREMKDSGVPFNTVTYNSIVDACARVGAMDRAAALLEDMLTSGVEPDLITFSTIIKGYCVQGDMTRSVQLLRAMTDRGIHPDGILCNSMLDGCVKAGRSDLCEELWSEMQNSKIAPSNFTLTILIKMYGRTGQLAKAFELVEQLPSLYAFELNAHVYTCLMSACITNREFKIAYDVFGFMLRDNIRPDAKTYETIIFGCTKGSLFAEAVEMIERALCLRPAVHDSPRRSNCGPPLRLEHRTYKFLFQQLAAARLFEEMGLPLLEKLRSAGISIPVNDYCGVSNSNGEASGRGNGRQKWQSRKVASTEASNVGPPELYSLGPGCRHRFSSHGSQQQQHRRGEKSQSSFTVGGGGPNGSRQKGAAYQHKWCDDANHDRSCAPHGQRGKWTLGSPGSYGTQFNDTKIGKNIDNFKNKVDRVTSSINCDGQRNPIVHEQGLEESPSVSRSVGGDDRDASASYVRSRGPNQLKSVSRLGIAGDDGNRFGRNNLGHLNSRTLDHGKHSSANLSQASTPSLSSPSMSQGDWKRHQSGHSRQENLKPDLHQGRDAISPQRMAFSVEERRLQYCGATKVADDCHSDFCSLGTSNIVHTAKFGSGHQDSRQERKVSMNVRAALFDLKKYTPSPNMCGIFGCNTSFSGNRSTPAVPQQSAVPPPPPPNTHVSASGLTQKF